MTSNDLYYSVLYSTGLANHEEIRDCLPTDDESDDFIADDCEVNIYKTNIDNDIKMKKYSTADFRLLFIKLVHDENILTTADLIDSQFREEFWLNAYAFICRIVNAKNYMIKDNDAAWSSDDYKMELTLKIVDQYGTIVKSYLKGKGHIYINGYASHMLYNLICDNYRKKPVNPDPFSTPVGDDDGSRTLGDTLFSDDNTEEYGIFCAYVCMAAKILNRLSSKGPLFAFVLVVIGGLDKILESTYSGEEFLILYNDSIDMFCQEIGIYNPHIYKASSLSEFAKDFDPTEDFDKAQVSRWQYIARNAIGSLFEKDVSPKQKRRPKQK